MKEHLEAKQITKLRDILQHESQLVEMSQLFKILGDVTRLKIMTLLTQREEMCVEDIIRCMNMEQSAISHQLRKLKAHHIVKSRKSGKHVWYSLEDHHVLSLYTLAFDHTSEK